MKLNPKAREAKEGDIYRANIIVLIIYRDESMGG